MCKKLIFQACLILVLGIANVASAATNPYPADGAIHEGTWVLLSWSPGAGTVSHDVYLGTSFTDVQNGTGGTFQGNQTSTQFLAGFPGFAYPSGLVPGTTYYWRVDDVSATGTTFTGPVWRFTVPSKIAHNPVPPNGITFVGTDVTLSWTAGMGAKLHDVYFGDSYADVDAGTGGTFQGSQTQTIFLVGLPGFPYPDGLVPGTTYYWRIDEFDGTAIHKGEVWNFTSAPDQGWVPFRPDAEPENLHAVKLKSSDNTGIAVDSDIPGMKIVNVPAEGDVYQRISIPYAEYTNAVGKPKVPIIRRYLEIPYNVEPTVEILYSDPTILDGYNVYPAQEPLLDMVTSEAPEFVKDHVTYSTDAFYPADNASVEEPVIMRGHRIAPLILFPVQHNPFTKQLRVCSKIEVRVSYDRPAQIEGIEERLESEAFESLCKTFILNYKPPERYLTRRYEHIGSPSVDYLIIAHDDFDTQVKPLADWKEKKGLRTQIVITKDICTNAAIDDVDEITHYLQDAYDTWNPPPTYVLLVGDSEFIPTHYQTAHPGRDSLGNLHHGGHETATDLYYGTLDGTDRFPDILVGRISVDTPAQTTTIVNKILDYEKNPPAVADFYTDISVVAFFQDTDDPATLFVNESNGFEERRFVLTSEEIRNDLLGRGYDVTRIYSTDSQNLDALGNYEGPTNYNNGDYDNGTGLPADLVQPYPGGIDPWTGNTAGVNAAYNAGRLIVNYRGHGLSQNFWDERPLPRGQWQGWMDGWGDPQFTTWDIPGLTNANLLPVVFSMTCQAGWFDGETDPYTGWNFECFCEEILRRQNGGAVAVIGATRNSFSGYNDDLMRGFYDAIWPDFDPTMTTGAIFELGQIHTYGKVHMAVMTPTRPWIDPDLELTTFEEYNLFGDPEMWIWTEQPTLILDATHPPIIGSGGEQRFVVNVTDGTDPVNHAAVCLFKDSDVHVLEYTDPDGNVTFSITPSTGGNMDITATAHNYSPYEGTMAVTDPGAAITVSPDIGPPGISFTINGSNFNAGETVSIDFGGTLIGTASASGGSFSGNFIVPSVPEGPTNVVATGQTSNRAAVAVFRVMPDVPLPDPYTYDQWEPSTWPFLNPSGGDPIWDSPSIDLYDGTTWVSSRDLIVGTTYTIKAKIHNNSTMAPANGTDVSFKWAEWGAGQRIWHFIDADPAIPGFNPVTVNVPAFPGTAEASVLWTPTIGSHCCIIVEIHHPWDSNLSNNKGQENTDVAPIASPAVISFDIENPTDNTGLVYLELTQMDVEGGQPEVLWANKIERPYPQILDPGEKQTTTITVEAPGDAAIGDTRILSVTASIGEQIIGGVEFTVVKDHPPVLAAGYVDPGSGIRDTNFTYSVTYTDEDNHPPMEGYPRLSIFKGGVPVSGSPFVMDAENPNDANYADGKIYTRTINLSEPGNDYTYHFWARDSLGIEAEGFAIRTVSGPFVVKAVPECLVVDDFENYTDYEPNRIFDSWRDGRDDRRNGAIAGYPEANPDTGEHFVETTIVHGGTQSMPYFYDNSAGYSEATQTLNTLRDWVVKNVEVLSLWFYGDPANDPEPIYLAVVDRTGTLAVVYHEDPSVTQVDAWMEWRIDLQVFADHGVDLTDVDNITIGFGTKFGVGGKGKMYFDDIRLCPAE